MWILFGIGMLIALGASYHVVATVIPQTRVNLRHVDWQDQLREATRQPVERGPVLIVALDHQAVGESGEAAYLLLESTTNGPLVVRDDRGQERVVSFWLYD